VALDLHGMGIGIGIAIGIALFGAMRGRTDKSDRTRSE
jgi:hypothetical protein